MKENGARFMIGTRKERLECLDQLYPVWEEQSIWTMFEKNCRRFGGNTFILTEKSAYTYLETREQAEHLAAVMQSMGIRAGDHVALQLPNCAEHVFLTLALSRIGAVRVPLHLKMSEVYFRFVLQKADISWIFSVGFSTEHFCCTIADGQWFRRKGKELETICSWIEFCQARGESREAGTAFQSGKGGGFSDILFTSGSACEPKGVMLQADALLRSAYASCRTRCMETGRRIYIPIPFHHLFAYVEGFLAVMLVGGCMILSENGFTVEHALEMMRDCKANDVICIASMMMNLLSRGNPRPEEYPKLHAAYWASACPDWVWTEAGRRFGISDITTGYGMTECGSTTFMLSPDDSPERLKYCHGRLKDAGSAGDERLEKHLLEVRIRDPQTNEEIRSDEEGELQCRGLTVTPGYYKNPEANQAAFTEDGWFRTGDLCRRLPDGYYAFCGRKDDVYKINGENVSPEYLDKVIEKCPGVRAVQTVGIPSEKYGAVGVAFVDVKQQKETVWPELVEYCEKNLAGYQMPKYFIFSSMDTWPCTSTGKISKKELKKRAEKLLHTHAEGLYEYHAAKTASVNT